MRLPRRATASRAGRAAVRGMRCSDWSSSPLLGVNASRKCGSRSCHGPGTPICSVALVADSVDVVKDGDALKQVPDNKIFVIDMKANPPKLAATVTGGK